MNGGACFASPRGAEAQAGGSPAACPARRRVVFVPGPDAAQASAHDIAAKVSVARHLAALLDAEFVQRKALPARMRSAGADATAYLVPSHTLHPRRRTRSQQEPPQARSFFGGFVPYPFVATKLITHPLVQPEARAPKGWSAEHGERIKDVVLPGRSVFTHADARRAAAELLALGPVRVKESGGVGGSGQSVIGSLREFDALLGRHAAAVLLKAGLVLEQNLEQITTCSIGQVQVGPWRACYYGVQHATRNGRGAAVYGGSTLTVFRGTLEDLQAQAASEPVRIAAAQALVYHREALRCYPGLVASRCNYDVLQGVDAQGCWKSGVLEQSWRIGGASGAEIAALRFFRDHPDRSVVRASTAEVYGPQGRAPAGAIVHFDGVDDHGDRLVKYAWTLSDDDDRQKNPHPGR